jgi:hypothetical protein
VEGDKEPLYEFTMQDLNRTTEAPVLPFNAYGTLAWARNEFENNSASSQVRECTSRLDPTMTMFMCVFVRVCVRVVSS